MVNVVVVSCRSPKSSRSSPIDAHQSTSSGSIVLQTTRNHRCSSTDQVLLAGHLYTSCRVPVLLDHESHVVSLSHSSIHSFSAPSRPPSKRNAPSLRPSGSIRFRSGHHWAFLGRYLKYKYWWTEIESIRTPYLSMSSSKIRVRVVTCGLDLNDCISESVLPISI